MMSLMNDLGALPTMPMLALGILALALAVCLADTRFSTAFGVAGGFLIGFGLRGIV